MFKNWEKTDKKCQCCGAIIERQRGITRQNMRRLLIPKWDLNEFIITLMLVMFLVLAYLYSVETAQCRDWIKPMHESKEECLRVCDYKCKMIFEVNDDYNLENITSNITSIKN